MGKKDALFSLIKALSKTEKRYFKLDCHHQEQPRNYLALFEELDSMDSYDESVIRAKFRHHNFVKQLHVTKNYLRKLILRSLRNFYAGDSSEMRLHNALQDIEILFKKDLFELCLKSIKSAQQLALKYQNHLALLEILGWKRRVQLLRKGPGKSKEEINEIIKQELDSLLQLNHLCEYWSLTINIPDRFAKSDFEKILKHPYLKDDSKANTYRTKILYYHLLYTSYTILNQPERSEEALNQLIDYLENQEVHLKEDPAAYATALNNKIGFYLNFKRLDEIPPLLELIRGIPQKYALKNKDKTTMKLWLRTYNVELEIYRDSGNYQQGLELIPKVRQFLEQYQDHIPLEYHVLFYYQFAYLLFMGGHYSQALKDINRILVQRYSGIRNDIIGYAQFLNLIIHYELNNITVLKYAVDASRRFLKKRGKVQPFEKVLLNFFSKISTRPVSNHRALFRSLDHQLFDEKPLMDENQLDYLNFKWWIKSKSSTDKTG